MQQKNGTKTVDGQNPSYNLQLEHYLKKANIRYCSRTKNVDGAKQLNVDVKGR